ncbi:hypothetical protein D3C86_2204470 [compost metagenome]
MQESRPMNRSIAVYEHERGQIGAIAGGDELDEKNSCRNDSSLQSALVLKLVQCP